MKICMLPKYGDENPYQILTKKGLENAGLEVVFGRKKRFLSLLANYFKYKPDWFHFDWIYFAYHINLPSLFKWIVFYLFKFQLYFLKNFTNCKIAYTLHNINSHETYHKRIDYLAQETIFKYADFIRVFSNSTKLKVIEKWPNADISKFIYQPEGSYVGYYPNTVSKKEARKKLGYNTNDFIILFLGSVRKYKGVLELIETVSKIKKDNWKLIIAGYRYDKEYCDEIETISKNKEYIKLLFGHQDEEFLQVLFNASDVVALPFKNIENSGSTILAMGFSKPILAPNIGVLKDRLKQQKELLFENSIDESFKEINRLSKDELKEIGQKNFKELKKHQWKDFATAFQSPLLRGD